MAGVLPTGARPIPVGPIGASAGLALTETRILWIAATFIVNPADRSAIAARFKVPI